MAPPGPAAWPREQERIVTADPVQRDVPWDDARLAAELRPALVRYFRRKSGSHAEAEDLAQDVLLRMLGRNDWKSVEHAKSYVFRAAANRWVDRQRRSVASGTRVEWDDEVAQGLNEEVTPECVLSSGQELDVVASALMELSARTRDVFMLVRLEHMKHATVAELLGISVSAVEKHLVKALAHLMRRSRREASP